MGSRSGKRGPDPLSSEELSRRGSHRAGRRAAEERGEIGRKRFVRRKSPPRAPLPGDEFAWGDPRRDSIETWLPLLLELPEWDPRWQAKGYRFDGHKARRAIGWIERNVYHQKGSRRGQLVRLDPWQRALIANLFGWVCAGGPRDGLRRFSRGLLYIAKKNGKSTLTGALAALAFVRLKEGGAKVLTAATTRGQAREVWEAARDVIVANPRLLALCAVWESRIQLYRDQTSVLEPISGEAGVEDGADCSFAILDELHRQNSTKLLTILAEGGSAREEPVFLMLTTADEIREPSPCNAVLAEAKAVRANKGDELAAGWNPTFLPAVYELDEGDDWRDEKNWRKANPGLGTVKSIEAMRASYRSALLNPEAAVDFKRFHLNLRVQNQYAPINLEKWASCAGAVEPATGKLLRDWLAMREWLRGKRCFLGADLAETNDMISLMQWFPEQRAVLPWYWATRKAANDRFRKNDPVYLRWAEAGALEPVDDDAIEFAPVVAKVAEIAAAHPVAGLGVDRAKALEFSFACERLGLKPIFVGQGWLTMTEPCDWLVTGVENRTFVHGNHPVLNWNLANLRFKKSGQRGKQPVKPSEAQKIDGVSAWLTARAVETLTPAAKTGGGVVVLG